MGRRVHPVAEEDDMADPKWGNCKSCKYFSSKSANPGDTELAKCVQPELSAYELSVSGSSGCNAYEARVAAGEAYEAPSPAVH